MEKKGIKFSLFIRERNHAELRDHLPTVYDYLQAIQHTLTHEYGRDLQLRMDIFPIFLRDPNIFLNFAESKMRLAYPEELLNLQNQVVDLIDLICDIN